jgi:Sec-independent protein secretion pathway component TatC
MTPDGMAIVAALNLVNSSAMEIYRALVLVAGLLVALIITTTWKG